MSKVHDAGPGGSKMEPAQPAQSRAPGLTREPGPAPRVAPRVAPGAAPPLDPDTLLRRSLLLGHRFPPVRATPPPPPPSEGVAPRGAVQRRGGLWAVQRLGPSGMGHAALVQRLQAPPIAPKTEVDGVGGYVNTPEVPAKVRYQTTESWLSYKAGDPQPVGAVPFEDPPGYQYIRNTGLTNLWIRFHLVNNNSGGPGTAKNLVPTSQKTNQHPAWKVIEAAEKAEYLAGRSYHFATEVTYNAAHVKPVLEGEKWQDLFPSQIDARLSTWNGMAWVNAANVMLTPGLPPLNPGLLDFDLTDLTAYMLHSLGVPESLARFMERMMGTFDLTDEDAFLESLFNKVVDLPDNTGAERVYRARVIREHKAGEKKLRDLINATNGIRIVLA